jgi:hypothetical protein
MKLKKLSSKMIKDSLDFLTLEKLANPIESGVGLSKV